MKAQKSLFKRGYDRLELPDKNVLLYGNFPIVCPNYRKDEEERKVMYVGVTRAIDNLYILN